MLVFCPASAKSAKATEALRKAHHAAGTDILPLFARLSAQEQSRVFGRSTGRQVVLANVAETR